MKKSTLFGHELRTLILKALITWALVWVQICFHKGKFKFDQSEVDLATTTTTTSDSGVIDKPSLCGVRPGNHSKQPLLVVVNSAVGHFAARSVIRNTWGGYFWNHSVSVYFLVATVPQHSFMSDTNVSFQRMIDQEHQLHGDLLQIPVLDSYRNLTLKTLSLLRVLAQHHCAESVRFVLKVDDDVLVNAPQLLRWTRTTRCTGAAFYGRLAHQWLPVRQQAKSKNFCPLLVCYSNFTFPDFVLGPAYLFDPIVAEPIVAFAQGHSASVIHLEDVYVTGVVTTALNITRHFAFAHRRKTTPDTACEFGRDIAWVSLSPTEIETAWNARDHYDGYCYKKTNRPMRSLPCD